MHTEQLVEGLRVCLGRKRAANQSASSAVRAWGGGVVRGPSDGGLGRLRLSKLRCAAENGAGGTNVRPDPSLAKSIHSLCGLSACSLCETQSTTKRAFTWPASVPNLWLADAPLTSSSRSNAVRASRAARAPSGRSSGAARARLSEAAQRSLGTHPGASRIGTIPISERSQFSQGARSGHDGFKRAARYEHARRRP